jgi:hypothetical protein
MDDDEVKNALVYKNGRRPEHLTVRDLFRERVIMDDAVYHVAPILSLVSIGAFIVCSLIALLGVVLVYLGSTGDSQMRLFGQELTTTNVGISAIFIGSVSLVLLIRRVMKSLDIAIHTKGH